MTAVSVILPIYNIREEYLIKCLESVMNQTFSDLEVLMVDDGSKPYVESVCISFEKKDGRFHYIRQENAGVSCARNNGLDHSRGGYICFVDPDDWLEADYVQTLYTRIEETGADIAIADCTVHYENHTVENRFLNTGRTVLKGKQKDLLLYQLIGKKICVYYPPEIAAGVPWGKIFRRSFIEKLNLRFVPGMKRMQDNIFCLYAIENADSIAYESAFVYCYRKESGSASYRFDPGLISYFEQYFDETRKFLDKYHKEGILYEALNMKQLTSFNSYLTYYFYRIPDKSTKEINAEIDALLNQEPYRSSLLKIRRNLLQKQEYAFVMALKYRMYPLLKLMVSVRSMIRK